MIYRKPNGVKYTDMCIYIDNNVYKDSFDESLVFQYLYHIVHMLAVQNKLFNRNQYYEDFAIFGATRIYLRLTNKKQFELDEEGNPKLKTIRSVLNYAKNVLYHLKVDFEQSNYYQIGTKDELVEFAGYSFNNILHKSIDSLEVCEFDIMISDISKTCRSFLTTIPYKCDTVEWMNIYVSVMLTLLNEITLSKKSKERIKHLTSTTRLKDKHINDAYKDACSNSTVLFRIDESIRSYITVLSRQLKHLIGNELIELIQTQSIDNIELSEYIINDFHEEVDMIDDYS